MRVFDGNGRADDSTEGLIMLCQDWITPSMVMAEIGCYRGISTAIFAQYASVVYAVDSWDGNLGYTELPRDMIESSELLFDKVCEQYSNIVKRKGMSVDQAIQFTDETLDAIYVDAAHDKENVNADFFAWIPKVRPGGVVSGHDYNMVAEWIPTDIGQLQLYSDSSWAYRK